VSSLSDADPALRLLAGSMHAGFAHDPAVALARIKLALREPRIKARLPQLALRVTIRDISANYLTGCTVPGERVDFEVLQGGKSLARKRWSSVFPGAIYIADPAKKSGFDFVPAAVNGGELLVNLLRHPAFTQDDLAELSRSEIPEVRAAAVVNLTGAAALTKAATEDPIAGVRLSAVRRISSRVVLEKIAAEDTEPAVREIALSRVRGIASGLIPQK
jgi:hypothetical protein